MTDFLRIRYKNNVVPPTAPVLMRMAFKQPAAINEMPALKRLLRSYPATVTYYGPLLKNQVSFIYQQFKDATRGQWMIFAYQIIPIAPQGAGHRWPHTDFRHWTAYENSAPPYYKLARTGSQHYGWRQVA